MAQLELPFGDTRRTGFDPKRSEPVVWVSRLSILRELRPDAVVREIRLRRGLNILWARPSEALEPRLNEGGLSGHTAGKTTFCRFLRYLLGEQRFAVPRVQDRIRTGPLAGGWVVGEVFVNGDLWVVGRPFALHVHPFAARGLSLEEAIAKGGGFQDFLDALSAATVDVLPARLLPGTARPIDWPLLLTWLTRDQEARFAGVEEWRSPRSESDSPSPPLIDRSTVVRAVLDVVSDGEAQLQRTWEELDRAKDEIDRAATVADVRGADRRRRLAEKLSISAAVLEDGALFVQAAAAEVEQRRREVAASRAKGIELAAEASAAETAKDEAAREHAELTGQMKALATLRGGWARKAVPLPVFESVAPSFDRGAEAPAATLAPAAPGRCNVPMAIARERGCPLAIEAPRRVEALAEIDTVEDNLYSGEGDGEGEPGDGATPDVAAPAALERAAELLRERRAAFTEIGARLADLRAHTASKEAALREAEELLAEARAAEREATRVEERRRDRAARMSDVSEKRASLRRAHAESRDLLSARFDAVLRALLGDQIRGRVDVTRDGLEPVALAQGDRESAALDTIKVLAFDLAALSLGFEGHGHFPGFLVHDGPREADMDQVIYDRVFLYAQQMEEAFLQIGSIGFQYIVTTTTPPPERLRRAPWLLDPVLDASIEEGRLLRMNL